MGKNFKQQPESEEHTYIYYIYTLFHSLRSCVIFISWFCSFHRFTWCFRIIPILILSKNFVFFSWFRWFCDDNCTGVTYYQEASLLIYNNSEYFFLSVLVHTFGRLNRFNLNVTALVHYYLFYISKIRFHCFHCRVWGKNSLFLAKRLVYLKTLPRIRDIISCIWGLTLSLYASHRFKTGTVNSNNDGSRGFLFYFSLIGIKDNMPRKLSPPRLITQGFWVSIRMKRAWSKHAFKERFFWVYRHRRSQSKSKTSIPSSILTGLISHNSTDQRLSGSPEICADQTEHVQLLAL